ncbi:uncharacterized protein LOC133466533 isoform X2 [Phyllopteryx taeniolatus]|uniref:uncharacterized protein LOC133466533 isoform X2 n=1 Tax=Phyllopteryx taeniolatus TaxID=161469 RepID=UPI002AD4E67D|nr:uncharacterized protein LOC133466533 isoform X2 [Phyllopteryx taeniolatus]
MTEAGGTHWPHCANGKSESKLSVKWALFGSKRIQFIIDSDTAACVSLDVHGARMTWSLGNRLCLIVFLSLIEPSKEDCKDYFTEDEWKNTTQLQMVSLVITENITNVAECTLESYCFSQKIMCDVLDDCFPKHEKSRKKCQPAWNVSVHAHHFKCLLAKMVDFHKTVNESVCPLFEKSWHAATALPTATAPQTIVTSPVWSSQTAPLPTSRAVSPKLTRLGRNEQHAKKSKACQSNHMIILTVLLGISSTLAMVLPLAVYFYMRRRKTQDKMWRQYGKASANSEVLMEHIGVSAS